MSKEATKLYRVTKPNTWTYKVGQQVKLTEKQARSLVNKVELIQLAVEEPEVDETEVDETETEETVTPSAWGATE